ncbi:MAG TPA: hypothetical protein VHH73_20350, partial [Verrucomicrobiae bacterium]|nr:hypothetical protein [Verrucomicrobiae bacterium]
MTHPPSSTLSAPLEALLFTPAPPGIGPEIRVGRDDLNSLDDRLAGFFAATGLPTGSEPLIRCAVLLWHDHLDPAHELAQEIANPSGSWLHGIMHRREPDYWNAKYWFQRVGNHPAAASLSHLAGALLAMPGHAALKTR